MPDGVTHGPSAPPPRPAAGDMPPRGEQTAESERAVAALHEFLRAIPRLFVLSGAGLSTASGIPAYRDDAGRWMRRQPIDAREFARDAAARRRYWARSLIGWPLLRNAQPNAGHRALSRLQAAGRIQRVVTQNVDGLHQQAGTRDVLELHGSVAEVRCLDCGRPYARADIQARLEAANPDFVLRSAAPAPDGDADVDDGRLERFEVPACESCGGMLKPHVVFFGDAVPGERVAEAMRDLQQSQAVLVVGSSLMLQSGFRFCLAAQRQGIPIVAINLGATRADDMLVHKLRQPCSEALVKLAEALD